MESIKFHVSRKVFRGIGWYSADFKFDLMKSGTVVLPWHRTGPFEDPYSGCDLSDPESSGEKNLMKL